MGKKFIDLANLKSNLENFLSEIITPTFATKESVSKQLGSHTVKSDVPENAVFTDTKDWESITGKPDSFPPSSHGHTISEITGLQDTLDGKANSSHTHGNGDITSLDASKITSGTISIDRLPQGALERLTIVADDTARFKLTSATIQKGDTVKVTSTGKMYYVVDETKLSTEAGYEVYAAGTAASVPWSGVTGKPSTYTPSSHTHTKTQITDFPTSMPANGGNADTVNSHTVKSDVPENAVFTDTVYDDTEVKEEIVSINSNLEQLEEVVSYVSHGKNLIGTELNKLYPVYIKANEKIVSSRYDGQVTSIIDKGVIDFYGKNKELIIRYSILLPNTSYRVITVPEDVYYLAWEELPYVDFQIEMGDVATSYEPYNPYGNKQNLIDILTKEKADKTETTINLLKHTKETITQDGVTFTNNNDGTYTMNGTATQDVYDDIKALILPKGKYKILGAPLSHKNHLYITKSNDFSYVKYSDEEFEVTDISQVYNVVLRSYTGSSYSDIVFKPMITTNLDATYDDFVPYTGDTGKLNSDVADIKNDLSKLQDNVDSSDIQYSAYIKNANGDITPSAITSSPKINEAVSQINNNIGVLLQGYNDQKSKLDNLGALNAGAHNSVYRGKYLGNALTTEQKEQISAGTFNDLYIGDYWTIGGVNYRIAAFDYWLNSGDTQCTTHHVVIVPDSNLYTAKMNDTDITTGAYVGSEMYKTNLAAAKTTINNAFGSKNILTHREYLANATKSTTDPTYESVGSWYDSTVELMNERMVYGADIFHNIEVNGAIPTNYTIDKSQLPLFALEPSRICNRADWWLRDVVSAASFAFVSLQGSASGLSASAYFGIRPVFGIKG